MTARGIRQRRPKNSKRNNVFGAEVAVSRICGSKRRYDSRTQAVMAARTAEVQGVEPYECPVCGGWHVGHRR